MMTINELAKLMVEGFDQQEERFNKIDWEIHQIKEKIDTLDDNVETLKKDMVWVKDVLDAHTGMLQKLTVSNNYS